MEERVSRGATSFRKWNGRLIIVFVLITRRAYEHDRIGELRIARVGTRALSPRGTVAFDGEVSDATTAQKSAGLAEISRKNPRLHKWISS